MANILILLFWVGIAAAGWLYMGYGLAQNISQRVRQSAGVKLPPGSLRAGEFT